MRLTRHNGRAGKDGVFSSKHNDRNFDLDHADHINQEMTKYNVYWDCYNGYRQLTFDVPTEDIDLAETFEDIEKRFYEMHYREHVEKQNARNAERRHSDRNRTTDQILKNRKTCPEETVYQIGTMDDHVAPEVLLSIVTEFITKMHDRFGEHVHFLDWALHLDEKTPHIHERHVFDCEDERGEIYPQQEKTLEVMDYQLPDPLKKKSRFNNRKMVFDAECRQILFDICKEHGLELEEEPEYGGREHMEKQDFIRMQQKKIIEEQTQQIEQKQKVIDDQELEIIEKKVTIRDQDTEIAVKASEIQKQEEQLEELTMRVEDIETLVDEVSEAAYDKAVEVVKDAVMEETHNADFQILVNFRSKEVVQDTHLSDKGKALVLRFMENLMKKFRGMTHAISERLDRMFGDPAIREKHLESIRKEARKSVLDDLHRKQSELARRHTVSRNAPYRSSEQEL